MNAAGTALWWQLTSGWREARRLAALWGPTLDLPTWLAPGIVLAGLLGLVVMTGIAIASLGVLITALLVLSVLLERVFGVTIAVG